MAPIKALCSERYYDWLSKFNKFGISCLEVTGDSDITDLKAINNYNILISTPEKWDSLTRRWRDSPSFVTSIKLFLIDEIHLVNEDNRGPTLEAVVSRMKTICVCSRGDSKINIRFIGMSATFPNIEDLGQWLGGKRAVLFKYTI